MRGYEESPAVYTDFLTAKGKQIYTTKGLTKRVKIRDLHGCRKRTEEHPLQRKVQWLERYTITHARFTSLTKDKGATNG